MPDIYQHFDYTVGEWKNEQFTKILSYLPMGIRVVYDVGANVGGWAHVMQERYGNKLQMICFEPVKANFEMLMSKELNIVGVPYGIFYGARESHVCSRGDNNCGGIFVEQIEVGDPIVKTDEIIQLRTFEELDLPKPDLIKFDVEGSEENILRHSTLVKETPWLIIEWHYQEIDPYGFFAKHLPNHSVMIDINKNQFLLKRND